MDSSTVEGGQSAIPRRPRRGAGPVSVDGSAWPVLERLVDDEEQQSDCYERDPDRVTEADHCAGNHAARPRSGVARCLPWGRAQVGRC